MEPRLTGVSPEKLPEKLAISQSQEEESITKNNLNNSTESIPKQPQSKGSLFQHETIKHLLAPLQATIGVSTLNNNYLTQAENESSGSQNAAISSSTSQSLLNTTNKLSSNSKTIS
jgi:hypothetical protein